MTVEDLEVANQGISNKSKIWIINKIILVVVEDSLEAKGARDVKASKRQQSDILCHYCGRAGHIQASCYRR